MFKVNVTTTGAREILLNLRLRRQVLESGVETGLKMAGLYLQRVSQQKVPVEFGNLKASAYTRAFGSGARTEVYVGYTAFYALYVHEQVAMKLKGLPRRPSPPHIGRYWDPQGRAQAKFLEEPARTERNKLLNIVLKFARIS